MTLLPHDGKVLLELLSSKAALRVVLDQVGAEINSRSQAVVNLDLETPEGLAEARKLQGEIKGGLLALDRIEEIIRDAS